MNRLILIGCPAAQSDSSACKVTLTLVFEPMSRLLAPAMTLGFQALADRMVDDFVRVADRDADVPHA